MTARRSNVHIALPSTLGHHIAQKCDTSGLTRTQLLERLVRRRVRSPRPMLRKQYAALRLAMQAWASKQSEAMRSIAIDADVLDLSIVPHPLPAVLARGSGGTLRALLAEVDAKSAIDLTGSAALHSAAYELLLDEMDRDTGDIARMYRSMLVAIDAAEARLGDVEHRIATHLAERRAEMQRWRDTVAAHLDEAEMHTDALAV